MNESSYYSEDNNNSSISTVHDYLEGVKKFNLDELISDSDED